MHRGVMKKAACNLMSILVVNISHVDLTFLILILHTGGMKRDQTCIKNVNSWYISHRWCTSSIIKTWLSHQPQLINFTCWHVSSKVIKWKTAQLFPSLTSIRGTFGLPAIHVGNHWTHIMQRPATITLLALPTITNEGAIELFIVLSDAPTT